MVSCPGLLVATKFRQPAWKCYKLISSFKLPRPAGKFAPGKLPRSSGKFAPGKLPLALRKFALPLSSHRRKLRKEPTIATQTSSLKLESQSVLEWKNFPPLHGISKFKLPTQPWNLVQGTPFSQTSHPRMEFRFKLPTFVRNYEL